ncbi:hypothetical protein CBL_07412 [Carabus blaptoides fortunei]
MRVYSGSTVGMFAQIFVPENDNGGGWLPAPTWIAPITTTKPKMNNAFYGHTLMRQIIASSDLNKVHFARIIKRAAYVHSITSDDRQQLTMTGKKQKMREILKRIAVCAAERNYGIFGRPKELQPTWSTVPRMREHPYKGFTRV